jgi:hypothetical protein
LYYLKICIIIFKEAGGEFVTADKKSVGGFFVLRAKNCLFWGRNLPGKAVFACNGSKVQGE